MARKRMHVYRYSACIYIVFWKYSIFFESYDFLECHIKFLLADV